MDKSLVLINGEYKKYIGNGNWQVVSTSLPTESQFINNGMDSLNVLDRKQTTVTIPMDDNGASGQVLGNGKVFKEMVDLSKYIDLTSINVK